jgi:hypothetical protein
MAQKYEKNEKTHFWCLKFGAWSSDLHRAKGGENTIPTRKTRATPT